MVRVYIADNQRMSAPPAWFCQRLYDYDSQLVLLPSRYKPYAYVIARRSRLGRRGLTGNAIADTITQPDTKMCMQYGCVPVCLMFQHGSQWNADTVLNKLKARDLWAAGEPIKQPTCWRSKRRRKSYRGMRRRGKSYWR